MKTFLVNDDCTHDKPCVATIGFFDGVHRGHQYLIRQVKMAADNLGMSSMVITFNRHPREVLNADYKPEMLNTFDEKIYRLSLTNVDNCAVLNFDKELAAMDAQEFMTKVLRDKLNVHTLIIGYDNHFGHGSNDRFDDYVRYGRKVGIDVVRAQVFVINGVNVSSSVVRSFLSDGEVEMAAKCLGYPYMLTGRVIDGAHEGRKLGFPTANLDLGCCNKIIPSGGVYAVKARLENTVEMKHAMLNIGVRPTLSSSGKMSVEAHLLHFEDDIYGKELSVSFIHRMREEKKFENKTELIEQLKADEVLVEEQFKKDIEE